MNVVSNAGPLITLGKSGQLGLLLRLYAVEIYGSILSYVSWPSSEARRFARLKAAPCSATRPREHRPRTIAQASMGPLLPAPYGIRPYARNTWRSRSTFSGRMGARGSRTSGEIFPIIPRAVLAGTGLVSMKRASFRGSSS
jgi:hypothetical protein